MTEKVIVEFTIQAGARDRLDQWLHHHTEEGDVESSFIRGYRSDDFVHRREALANFVNEMETVLRKHDHKTSWRERPIEALIRLLRLELAEFDVAYDFFEVKEARKELVDLSNFCLIVWDRLGMFDPEHLVQDVLKGIHSHNGSGNGQTQDYNT